MVPVDAGAKSMAASHACHMAAAMMTSIGNAISMLHDELMSLTWLFKDGKTDAACRD